MSYFEATGDFKGDTKLEVKEWILANVEGVTEQELSKYAIVSAYLYIGDYDGRMELVLLELATGDLKRMYSSHCSCNGFEWETPE